MTLAANTESGELHAAAHQPATETVGDEHHHAGVEPSFRTVAEFLLSLIIATSVFRAFVIEAYLVPTGSMAPHLVGHHRQMVCPTCKREFAVGVREDGSSRVTQTDCPNCGAADLDVEGVATSFGDRLLVQKGVFDLRPPHRWEAVVFHNPDKPREFYVKRVVARPGERVQLVSGDVYINDEIARKPFAQFRQLALPVFDQELLVGTDKPVRWVGSGHHSRWQVSHRALTIDDADRLFRDEDARGQSNDRAAEPLGNRSASSDQTIAYRQPDRDRGEAPISDAAAYNPDSPTWERAYVTDLMLQFALSIERGTGVFEAALQVMPRQSFVLQLDAGGKAARLFHNRDLVAQGPWTPQSRRPVEVNVAFWDQTCGVRVGGLAPFADYELDGRRQFRADAGLASSRPFALTASGLSLAVERIRIERDIHYASRVSGALRPVAVDKAFQLGKDEYFMLGDNSAISEDSRLWDRPAVPHRLLVGKPILVHLPASATQAQWFGRTIQFFDWRRIRWVK